MPHPHSGRPGSTPGAQCAHAQGVPAVNWVKWGILKLFQKRNQKVLKSRGIKAPVFFGMFYTCEMKREVVEALLPAYRRHARKRGRNWS